MANNLFDIINKLCSKRFSQVSEDELEYESFMLRRKVAAGYPVLMDQINSLKVNPLLSSITVALVLAQYNRTPPFIYAKSSNKDVMDILHTNFSKEDISKWVKFNQSDIKVMEELAEFNLEELKKEVKEISKFQI